ncbi:DUF4236 domain-containing protein [Ancylobacter mangrovi]|uniref:DUF4236 domain-containing protein n=1 Tax=Ancylobacter mangrovi TaxID=2972472 RepID=UPI002161CDC8|nr:DUF4236 domain-containing protein [Ancylobacter mangrovi]MCS0502700.1 DUF4236 domain-containing protein [Ancylobacter mangrovi]
MPFYIRKSVSAGPFRFNLSSSGVGMSVGIKGFRVGTGPRGNYVHMGLGGIYYRATLPSAHRPANAFSGPRARPDPPPAPDGLTEIASGPISQMAPASAQELLARIAETQARVRLVPVVVFLAGLAAGLALVWKIPLLVIGALIGGVLLFAWAKQFDDRRKAVLLYALDPEAQRAFGRLCEAFDALLAAERIWRIDAQGRTDDWKRNAGASSLVRRKPLQPSYAEPRSVASNLSVPCLDGTEAALLLSRPRAGLRGRVSRGDRICRIWHGRNAEPLHRGGERAGRRANRGPYVAPREQVGRPRQALQQ